MAAARSLADSGIGKALPKLKEALADLPPRIKAATIERRKRGGDHRSPSLPPSSSDVTLDAIGEALAQDLPGTNWRNGNDGVLDTPWAADPDLLPDLLPIAISGAHAGFDGNHRTATFEAASDAQMLALGVGQTDVANIRAGLERSPHHAARAIDDAFARLDPNSDIPRATRAELAAGNSDSGGITVTARPDGTFLVRDADGNEIGTAKDPVGADILVTATNSPPISRPGENSAGGGNLATIAPHGKISDAGPRSPAGKKPLYSPDPQKWILKGGSIDENWTYTDWEGNSVSYPDGFPDFKTAGFVRAEAEIIQKGNYTSDFEDAEREYGDSKPVGTTWHHHQNRTTMQAVDSEIHARFTHRGGRSAQKWGK